MKNFAFLWIIFLIAFTGCGKTKDFSGQYEAHNPDRGKPPVILELKPDGKGVWAFDDNEVSFKWEVRGKEIWLHTKAGGVIVGNMKGKSIWIQLPGVGEFRFMRVK